VSNFSDENVARAILRVPATSTSDLARLLEVATTQEIPNLVSAIEDELAIRGPVKFDKDSAEQHAAWADQIGEANVEEAILMAFRELPINESEKLLALSIAQKPGIAYVDLVDIRGKGDVGLVLGHMIYERLGFFRKFVASSNRMSDILFERESTDGTTRYRLTPAAQKAFATLQII
jgi:hypothetical protein